MYDSAGDFTCNFCDNNFKTKRDMMKHKKKQHREKLADCWQFATGNCQYGDEHCWFNHLRSDFQPEPVEIKCILCEKVFKTHSEFLKHKKQHHKQHVSKCKNADNGTCRYGNELCWFVHESNERTSENERSINYNQEVFEKIFSLIEKITERVVIVENVV